MKDTKNDGLKMYTNSGLAVSRRFDLSYASDHWRASSCELLG